MQYGIIVIIYNPISTGNSKQMAHDLKTQLTQRMPKQKIALQPTKHAGHGEEIAYKIASTHSHPLIISCSGDGGYNEVINGAMKAKSEGAMPIVSLLPAGNANDHFNDVHSGEDMVDLIVSKKTKDIDLLCVTAKSTTNKLYERYAHSYVGVGITPWVGKELTKAQLNSFNEIFIVLKAIISFKPIRLQINNKSLSFSSIVFSNIGRMAKILNMSKDSKEDDGKFEVTMFPTTNKLRLISMFLKLSLLPSPTNNKVERYRFNTLHKTLMQLDGEVIALDAGSPVTIKSIQKALTCVI